MGSIVENIVGMDASMHDEWTLSNGLRVVGERLPYLRTVSMGVWLHVGSMFELPQENGLSHFMEHMVFKGTGKRTARQIAEEMDAVGGQLNAFTGKDCTCFYAKVIDEDVALAADILADLVTNATLDEAELEKERGVILEEIAMDEDSPEDLVHDLLSKAMFGDQSLGMPILGTEELIAGYRRQSLVDYRAKHYSPERTVIALAGNYDPDAVKELLEKFFGGWRAEIGQLQVPKETVLTGQRALREKDTEQMHICLGFPGASYGSEDIYPQAALNNLLGGAMSSRLFQRIREDLGMAYSIYTYPNTYQGCGTFAVYAGVSPKNAERVLEEIRRELDRLLHEGILEKEYRDAKQQLRCGYLMGLESPGSRMQAMGRMTLLLGKPSEPQETIAKIEAVTMDKVMDCARRVLTAEPCIAVVGRGAENLKL